jgi:class 3 adenylate cyclase
MARLSARERAALPDRAFAYIDSSGQRRLPINDAAHVRAALGRFSRVRFESEESRDAARQRLLNAAKRHGIMPVGFITGQFRTSAARTRLPTGGVTFVLMDMEGSTALLRELDDEYARLLREVRALIQRCVDRHRGHRVDAHGDEFFAVFADPHDALTAAVDIQRHMASHDWPCQAPVRVRSGLHSGRPTLTDTGYVGLSVHTVARICAVAHGEQVVVSAATRTALRTPDDQGGEFELLDLGSHRLSGLPQDEQLFQVVAPGLRRDFPPLRLRV